MMQPKEVSEAQWVFPANVVKDYMPAMDDIPEEFSNWNRPNKWSDLQSKWFYEGLKGYTWVPKEGIDLDMALRHLSAIQRSFEPKHEHKAAAVAYLMSLWFDDVKGPNGESVVK
jgi:hypothetical protein